MWSEKEIFYQTKFKTQNLPIGKLPLKNQKQIGKYFPAPILPLFVKTVGHTATNFPGSTLKLHIVAPFEYLA